MKIESKPYKNGIMYTAHLIVDGVKEKVSKFYSDPNTSELEFVKLIGIALVQHELMKVKRSELKQLLIKHHS